MLSGLSAELGADAQSVIIISQMKRRLKEKTQMQKHKSTPMPNASVKRGYEFVLMTHRVLRVSRAISSNCLLCLISLLDERSDLRRPNSKKRPLPIK